MTVSTTTNKVSYSGTGSQTVFAYSFKIFADGDLDVYIRDTNGTETLQTITTHYTVSGAGSDSGGNVTFVTAPGSTDTVVIQRKLDLTQGTDYVANDPFPAASHEDALDRLTFITQQIQEEVDRSIKASVTNTISSSEFAISASDRANKIFAFDASGDLAVTQEIGTFRGNWAASTDYEQRDLVKDTSTNNIFIVNTAHTSSGAEPLTTNANSAKYDLIVDAASATTSQTAAAASASSASTSASTATTKAAEAATSAAASAASATAAAASETAAAASETASAASETASAASETASAASQTAAAASATSASSSASTATTKASEASTSASTATTKASEAASSQTAAASSASSASTDAATATTKAGEASTSATNAASSATAAASSATAAAASQTAAAASAASAASAFDNFDDTYLGSKTSDPTTDNDGDPLTSGDLYFNSTANEMRVYDGANWIAATSAGNVSLILYEYTATAGQTTFSGSDDNSATLSYTADNLQVVMNGVVLDPSDFTATSGTSVVLASGAALNDIVNIYAFKSFTTADMVSASAGGTFSANVAVTGDLTVADKIIHSGDTDTAIRFPAADNISFETGGGEKMVIDNTGVIINDDSADLDFRVEGNNSAHLIFADGGNDKVGFGASVPTQRVSIEGTANDQSSELKMTATAVASGYIGPNSNGLNIGTDTAGIVFKTGVTGGGSVGNTGTERMRLQANGRFNIHHTGDIGPAALQVRDDSEACIGLQRGGGTSGYFNYVLFANNGNTALIGSIQRVNDASVQYNTTSDARLKENIADMTGAITRVKQLAPKRYSWVNEDLDAADQDGFLAHEAQAVVPMAVSGTQDEVDDDGNPVYMQMDYSKLVPLLTGALQEAIAKIETLETKVAALEAAE